MGRKAKSFADLLPWGQLGDSGMVFTKQGHVVVGYYFSPPDNDSRTEDEADVLADQVNEAMTSFGSGWASWSDVIAFPAGRYPAASESCFPDPFSRAVDEARRERFEANGEHWENDRAFLVSYLPPRQQVSRLSDLFFTSGGGKRIATQQQVIDTVGKTLRVFENRVAGMLKLRRMQSFEVVAANGSRGHQDELINYLNFCATGRVRGVMLPRSGAFLDGLITGQDAYTGENPVIGSEYIGVVAIEGFPAESQPNVISALNTLALPYRFTQRMIYLDSVHAGKEIGRYRDKWGQQVRGLGQKMLASGDGPVNEYALRMKTEANTALAWAKSGDVKFGFYSATVIVRHTDAALLRKWTNDIAKIIERCGFGSRIEETNTVEAWIGSLPGETTSNVRRPLLHTRTAADLMPLSGVWTGDERAPCPMYSPNAPALLWAVTDGQIPFRLNLHIGPRSDLGHTLVLGPTSMGKSTLTNTMAMQARRYADMRITAFDYKRGMMATALACGGNYYDLAGDATAEGMFCPFGVLDSENDIEWAADYAAILYELQTKSEPDSGLRVAINQAMRDLAQAPVQHRSMTSFASALQDTAARRVFQFYTVRGGGGAFLDGIEDSADDSSDFSAYECKDLLDLGEVTALPVLLYQFRRFERSLDGRPALLFIAEAWQALSHPLWRTRLAKWLRTLRSKNCCVIMDTQSLADVVGSPILSLLNDSCQRKIFLPNPTATQSSGQSDNPGSYELYRGLGLNDRQIRQIQTAIPKSDYYITGPDGCRMVSLGLGPLELAIAGATSEQDVLAVRQAVNTHGKDWLPHFLADKGITYGTAATKEMVYA